MPQTCADSSDGIGEPAVFIYPRIVGEIFNKLTGKYQKVPKPKPPRPLTEAERNNPKVVYEAAKKMHKTAARLYRGAKRVAINKEEFRRAWHPRSC